MTPQDQIKSLAELDGKQHLHQFEGDPYDRDCYICGYKPPHENHASPPDYLHSYDAIIPLIQKQPRMVIDSVWSLLSDDMIEKWQETPAQLSEALLRATGKWKD